MDQTKDVNYFSPSSREAALRTAVTIMDKWRATPDEIERVLRLNGSMSPPSFETPTLAQLDDDHLIKISHILNIHSSLRFLFDTPEKAHAFPSMANHHAPFQGKSLLEFLGKGDLICLEEAAITWLTSLHVNSLAGSEEVSHFDKPP
jgi:hypothetical protein